MIKFGFGDSLSAEIIRLVGKLLGTEKSHKNQRSPVLSRYFFLWLTLNRYSRDPSMLKGALKSRLTHEQIIVCCSPTSPFSGISLGILGKDDVRFLRQFDSAWPLHCQQGNVKDGDEPLYAGKFTWLWGRMRAWSKRKENIKYLKHFTMKSPSPPSPTLPPC